MKNILLIASLPLALWACQPKTSPTGSNGFKIIGSDSLVLSKDSARVRIIYPVSNNEAANKLLQTSILAQLQHESGHNSSSFQALADSFAADRKAMGKEYELSNWYLHSDAVSLCANDSLWSVLVQNEQYMSGETPIKSMQTVNILHQSGKKVGFEHFIKPSAVANIQNAAPSTDYGKCSFKEQIGLDSQNLRIYYASSMAAEDFIEVKIPLEKAKDYLK